MICLDSRIGQNYAIYNGDSCEVIPQLPERCADLIVYSPPFSDLYVYSDSERDMGNSTEAEFAQHYGHLLPHLFRALRPGRLCAVHCMDLPARKSVEGWMGLRDFSGDLIRMHTAAGFHYLSRITIWKDPVTQMQRSKAHNLLFMNILEDCTRNYNGLPDYVLLFRRPVLAGDEDSTVPVPHRPGSADMAPSAVAARRRPGNDALEEFTLDQWQEWASPVWPVNWSELPETWHDPVWMDIDQQETLNGERGRRDARGEDDERHICPLQLPTIRRLVKMYTNPGEVVLSPFGGIGSEPYVALQEGRKGVAVELKGSYFRTMAANLASIENVRQAGLFDRAAK